MTPQETQLDRIERKLDILIQALSDEEQDMPSVDLDGGLYEATGDEPIILG